MKHNVGFCTQRSLNTRQMRKNTSAAKDREHAGLALPKRWYTWAALAVTTWLASCVSPPAPSTAPTAPTSAAPGVSMASSAREYRRDAARHLYQLNPQRIYKGMMPPLLQAVAVMQVELDGNGNVRKFEWMRAPRHVPAVMAEIERMVRNAAPYPAPRRLGKVVYTDTWLWDKSGLFQLDTLTEGQLSQ